MLLLDRGRVVFWGNLDHVRAVADHKLYEVICVDPDSARRVVDKLGKLLDSNGNITRSGSMVVFRPETDRR